MKLHTDSSLSGRPETENPRHLQAWRGFRIGGGALTEIERASTPHRNVAEMRGITAAPAKPIRCSLVVQIVLDRQYRHAYDPLRNNN